MKWLKIGNNEDFNQEENSAEFICTTVDDMGCALLIFRNNTDYILHGDLYYTSKGKETDHTTLPSFVNWQINPDSYWAAMVHCTTDDLKSLSWEYSLTDDKGHDYSGEGKSDSTKFIRDYDTKTVEKQMETEKSEPKPEPKVGMTKAEVLESSWGSPRDRKVHEYEWGTTEQWVYRKGYIYFENGIVTSITFD